MITSMREPNMMSMMKKKYGKYMRNPEMSPMMMKGKITSIMSMIEPEMMSIMRKTKSIQ